MRSKKKSICPIKRVKHILQVNLAFLVFVETNNFLMKLELVFIITKRIFIFFEMWDFKRDVFFPLLNKEILLKNKISRYLVTSTVKLGYTVTNSSGPAIFVRYNRFNLCTKITKLTKKNVRCKRVLVTNRGRYNWLSMYGKIWGQVDYFKARIWVLLLILN
jgi:hypothetical protein